MSVPTTGEVKITIQLDSANGTQNTTGANGDAPSPSNPAQEGKLSKNPVNASDGNSQAKLAVAVQVAKTVGTQAINAAVSNIGLATGNYYLQQQTQAGLSAVTTLAGLAVAAANPVTFGLAIAGMAISAGSDMYKQYKERQYDNYVAAQNARRMGYTEARR